MTSRHPERGLRLTRAADIPTRAALADWGPWRLLPASAELVIHVSGQYSYAVDLEECLTSAQVLDWIAQVAAKTWAGPEVVAGLVAALDDVIHLQARLCSGGQHRRTTRTEVRKLARRFAAEWPVLVADRGRSA